MNGHDNVNQERSNKENMYNCSTNGEKKGGQSGDGNVAGALNGILEVDMSMLNVDEQVNHDQKTKSTGNLYILILQTDNLI